MTDIAELAPTERTIQICNPENGEPLGISVTLVGPSDPRLEKLNRSILDSRLSLEKKGKTFKAEEVYANRDRILFTAMTGWEWSGDVTFEGEKPELNLRNVTAIFKKLPWFRTQIDEAFSEQEAFFGTSKSD